MLCDEMIFLAFCREGRVKDIVKDGNGENTRQSALEDCPGGSAPLFRLI